MRSLLGLDGVLSLGLAGPTHDERSWTFDLDPGGVDPVLGYERLQQAYFARFPDYDRGITVPALVDVPSGALVTNEGNFTVSAEGQNGDAVGFLMQGDFDELGVGGHAVVSSLLSDAVGIEATGSNAQAEVAGLACDSQDVPAGDGGVAVDLPLSLEGKAGVAEQRRVALDTCGKCVHGQAEILLAVGADQVPRQGLIECRGHRDREMPRGHAVAPAITLRTWESQAIPWLISCAQPLMSRE